MKRANFNEIVELAITAKREGARWESAVMDRVTKDLDGTFDEARQVVKIIRPHVNAARS
jgi:hypothetical protein